MKAFRRRGLAGALAAAFLASSSAHAADDARFGAAVDGAVQGMILPAYSEFAGRAADVATATRALCSRPSKAALASARTTFAALTNAFARIELFRFGPAQTDNRFERLFFWPDRRGRGFRQVATILRDADSSAASPDTLAAKSVAVQGLPALDHVLFGKGAGDLAADVGAFRCRYAAALGVRIVKVAGALDSAWSTDFAAVMGAPSAENADFRSSGEVVQTLLRSAREQLQTAAAFKIGRPLGRGQGPAKPRTAPYFNAGLGLTTTEANVRAVRDLIDALDLADVLPDGQTAVLSELAFYLDGAVAAMGDARRLAGGDWPAVATSADARTRLAYAPLALGQAIDILENRLPSALGLIAGFNALDGD